MKCACSGCDKEADPKHILASVITGPDGTQLDSLVNACPECYTKIAEQGLDFSMGASVAVPMGRGPVASTGLCSGCDNEGDQMICMKCYQKDWWTPKRPKQAQVTSTVSTTSTDSKAAPIEIEKLKNASLDTVFSDFSDAMYARLVQKEKEGYTGWDGEYPTHTLLSQMEAGLWRIQAGGYDNKKLLTDLANRAMMLWYRCVRIQQEQAKKKEGV